MAILIGLAVLALLAVLCIAIGQLELALIAGVLLFGFAVAMHPLVTIAVTAVVAIAIWWWLNTAPPEAWK